MSKLFQNTSSLVFAAAAFAVISASAVSPAAAQGVPAGLLRLDSSQAYNAQASVDEIQQPKVRNTYAHVRKHKDEVR
jgi:hypothetical protein